MGSLFAGLYLLRFYDIAVGTYAAVLINVTVAAAAWGLAGRAGAGGARTNAATAPAPATAMATSSADDRRVYATIALSGLTALSAQVIWTRLLSLLFGGTVYTFSLILAVFLAG